MVNLIKNFQMAQNILRCGGDRRETPVISACFPDIPPRRPGGAAAALEGGGRMW